MKEAKKALRAAADAVTSIHIQTIDVENIHASANEIFGDAEEKIKSCFDHYQVLFFFFPPTLLWLTPAVQAYFVG